jgi:hypothetical protein
MAPFGQHLVAGVDGLGTMTLGVEGWAFLVLPKEAADHFEEDAKRILKGTTLKAFHGKDYKRRFREAYRDFLALVHDGCRRADCSVMACVLLDSSLLSDFRRFCHNVIDGALTLNHIAGGDFAKTAEHVAPALFSLIRHTANCACSEIEVVFDLHSATEGLPERILEGGERSIGAASVIRIAYNEYNKLHFPSSPRMTRNGLRFARDEESFLIQAADIFGNFSTAAVKRRLGKKSSTILEKATLFEDVFGDLLAKSDLSEMALIGDDLILRHGGALALVIKHNPLPQNGHE